MHCSSGSSGQNCRGLIRVVMWSTSCMQYRKRICTRGWVMWIDYTSAVMNLYLERKFQWNKKNYFVSLLCRWWTQRINPFTEEEKVLTHCSQDTIQSKSGVASVQLHCKPKFPNNAEVNPNDARKKAVKFIDFFTFLNDLQWKYRRKSKTVHP